MHVWINIFILKKNGQGNGKMSAKQPRVDRSANMTSMIKLRNTQKTGNANISNAGNPMVGKPWLCTSV